VNDSVIYRVGHELSSEALNALYKASWPAHEPRDELSLVLDRSLTYVCAYEGSRLIGFVYVAWDRWQHAFLLDPTVHPEYRHRGIGTALVRRATAAAREAGCEWLHVDYEAGLSRFYKACGFTPTSAGLIRLN
jgi:GNAT superfamily N-acetyltransferase